MERLCVLAVAALVAALGLSCPACSENDGDDPTHDDAPWREGASVAGEGQALAVLGDGVVVSASSGGLQASGDGGRSWEPLDATGLPSGHVISMTATDDDSLVAYVWGHGLFGSDDAGTSWSPLGELALDSLLSVATNTRAEMVPYVLSADPEDAAHLVAAGPGGYSVTEDGGLTWDTLSVPGGEGGVNILFTGAAVVGDELYATAQLPVGILPPFFLEILAGGVYYSDNRGAAWRQLGDAFPTPAPSAIVIGPDDAVYVSAQDGGLFRLDLLGHWESLGGPSDVLTISTYESGIAVASGTRGPWLFDIETETWSRAADGDSRDGIDTAAVSLADRYALLSDGRFFAVGGGSGSGGNQQPAGGTVYIAFSMHTNLYHSFRGNTNDADGFGLDITVIRNTLDWLDELPEVHADWDIENYFSLDGWLEEFAPDIIERIRVRREAGQDGIRLMSWNNGAVSWQTFEEFEQSVERAKTSYVDRFGGFDSGVQPQENMFSPDHVGWYRQLGIDWITLFNAAAPFTAIPLDVELEAESLYNPVTLRDGDDTMTLVPVYHHTDVLDRGNLAGWAQALSDRFPGDVLLAIHFDADSETWLNFDEEIRAASELDFVEFTTLQGYLDTHSPVDEVSLPGDLADGIGDGFFSWAEKQVNQYLSTKVARARDLTDWARALAPEDMAVEALVQQALETRLITLSTTNLGLSAPYLHPDREADARALADRSETEARAAFEAATIVAGEPSPGTIELVHTRDSAGTALVEIPIEVPKDRYVDESGLVIEADGAELPMLVDVRDAVADPVVIVATIVIDFEPGETKMLAWRYDPARPRSATASVGPLADLPLQAPFTECNDSASEGVLTGTSSGVDGDGVRRFESRTYDLGFCDGTGQVTVTLLRYDGHPGTVVEVDATMGQASDPSLAQSVALTPFRCAGDVSTLRWRTMGGVERVRLARRDQQTWNPASPDGWFALECDTGETIAMSHRVRERTSLGPLVLRNDEGQGVFAPLGTLWGTPPFHNARRMGGYGVGDVVYQIIGDNFYQPVAPDWSGATFSYRLLVDSSVDSGTLDLFAHPPLARAGVYVEPPFQ
jgi:hypothetical protein